MTIALADQLRDLGLDAEAIAESAELKGDRFDPAATLERLRSRLSFYERELQAMHAFAAKWNAPMDEVTDLHGDYEGAAARPREAIA